MYDSFVSLRSSYVPRMEVDKGQTKYSTYLDWLALKDHFRRKNLVKAQGEFL